MLTAALAHLARYATWWLAGGVLIGLAAPPLAELLRPLLVPIIFANLILALLRLQFADILGYLRRPVLIGLFVAVSLIACPVVMWLVTGWIGLPAGLAVGLILMAAAPPITSAPSFALIMGLDAAFSIACVVVSHVLVPLTLPVMALWLLDLELDISTGEFMGRLAAMIGGSFAIAWALKRWLVTPAVLARHLRSIDGIAVLCLVVFAIAIMDGVSAFLLSRPDFIALTVLCAFAANALLQAAGAGLFLGSGRRIGFTAGHMLGNCNMGLVLAVLADRAEFEVIVFFALAQLPMYMLPLVAVPLYRRLI